MDVPPRAVELALGRDRGEGGRGAGVLEDGLEDGHNHKITCFVRVSRKVKGAQVPEGQGVDREGEPSGQIEEGEGLAAESGPVSLVGHSHFTGKGCTPAVGRWVGDQWRGQRGCVDP